MTRSPAPRLGILTNDPDKVFQRNVIEGARAAAEQLKVDTEVYVLPGGVDDAGVLPFDPAELAGLLVIANVASDDVLRVLYGDGLPISLVSHAMPGAGIPAVTSDNDKGIAELVRHIVDDCQRRKPVFIQGHMGQIDGISRDRAFREALIRHGVPDAAATAIPGDFNPDVAARSLAQLLAAGEQFDAVVAADYLMAVAAVDVLRAAGRDVPEDVCVAGFGDGPEAATAGLTTVAANVRELGHRACRQLIGQMQGLSLRGTTVLATELVQRETTRPR